MKQISRYVGYIGLWMATACQLAPEYQRPAVETPAEWRHGVSQQSDAHLLEGAWWRAFKSDELNHLVVEALEYNQDMVASLARIEQARARARNAGSSRWPDADSNGTVGRTKDK
jgi:outer membrane protein, multidrug efflux system